MGLESFPRLLAVRKRAGNIFKESVDLLWLVWGLGWRRFVVVGGLGRVGVGTGLACVVGMLVVVVVVVVPVVVVVVVGGVGVGTGLV